MKKKSKRSVLSREEHSHFAKELHLLTAGKDETVERGMVINARDCHKPGGWVGWERIYKDMLFRHMVELDADFFKRVVEAIEYVQSGAGDDNPQAAAVAKAWYVLTSRNNELPTIGEIAAFAHANSKAVKHWDIADKNYDKTVRYICTRYDLKFRAAKRGRKPKIGK